MAKYYRGYHTITYTIDMHTYVYLEQYGLLMTGDVNTVGLSIGHIPVVYIDIIRLSGATQVVANLKISYIRNRGEKTQ